MHTVSAGSGLLHDSETWSLKTEDMQILSMFENRCLGGIGRIWRVTSITQRLGVIH